MPNNKMNKLEQENKDFLQLVAFRVAELEGRLPCNVIEYLDLNMPQWRLCYEELNNSISK